MFSKNIKNLQSFKSFDMDIKLLTLKNHFNGNIGVEYVTLRENSNHKPHYHEYSDAFIYILSGDGLIITDDCNINYTTGSIFYFEKKIFHGFAVNSETQFISIQSPPIKDSGKESEDIHFRS